VNKILDTDNKMLARMVDIADWKLRSKTAEHKQYMYVHGKGEINEKHGDTWR